MHTHTHAHTSFESTCVPQLHDPSFTAMLKPEKSVPCDSTCKTAAEKNLSLSPCGWNATLTFLIAGIISTQTPHNSFWKFMPYVDLGLTIKNHSTTSITEDFTWCLIEMLTYLITSKCIFDLKNTKQYELKTLASNNSTGYKLTTSIIYLNDFPLFPKWNVWSRYLGLSRTLVRICLDSRHWAMNANTEGSKVSEFLCHHMCYASWPDSILQETGFSFKKNMKIQNDIICNSP